MGGQGGNHGVVGQGHIGSGGDGKKQTTEVPQT
jgi:hypothetical protein